MTAVTKVFQVVSYLTGPSCCKAYVRGSLEVAAGVLKEKLEIILAHIQGSSMHPLSQTSSWLQNGKMPLFQDITWQNGLFHINFTV